MHVPAGREARAELTIKGAVWDGFTIKNTRKHVTWTESKVMNGSIQRRLSSSNDAFDEHTLQFMTEGKN
jgi:hypothetical protein